MLLLKEVPAIRKGGCQAKNCIFERKVLQSDRRSLKAAQAGMARTSSIFRSLFSEVKNARTKIYVKPVKTHLAIVYKNHFVSKIQTFLAKKTLSSLKMSPV